MPRFALLVFAYLFAAPLIAHAIWWQFQDHAPAWNRADWSSAGLLPPAAAAPDAMVRVYAARTGRWKGIFAHHTWIVVKEAGADRYTRWDKVGWGRPVRENGWAPDGRWYGNTPELVAAFDGEGAAALIPRIRAAVKDYPYAALGGYRVWPGPNSNSFVAHVLAAIPEAGVALPPTALGKDFRGLFAAGATPSGTGVSVMLGGLAGVTIALEEGLELNLLGLVAGLDWRHPAVKLPGWGRVGLPRDTAVAAPVRVRANT